MLEQWGDKVKIIHFFCDPEKAQYVCLCVCACVSVRMCVRVYCMMLSHNHLIIKFSSFLVRMTMKSIAEKKIKNMHPKIFHHISSGGLFTASS